MVIGSRVPQSYITHIRDVALLPGEQIRHVFSPYPGLTQEPPVRGKMLVTTNQRILAFSQEDGRRQTYLVPVEELKGVVVKSGGRSYASLFQGLLLVVGGIFVYLALAYWLTGQFNGPSVPVLNMDIGAILVLLALLIGVVLIGRYYLAKEDGSVIFQGSGWVFTFPYQGAQAGEEIYQVVNSVFAARQSHDGFTVPSGEQLQRPKPESTEGM